MWKSLGRQSALTTRQQSAAVRVAVILVPRGQRSTKQGWYSRYGGNGSRAIGSFRILESIYPHLEHYPELITARGARIEYLPPYSPDLNPIEKCWAKLKTALRHAKARTREAFKGSLIVAIPYTERKFAL